MNHFHRLLVIGFLLIVAGCGPTALGGSPPPQPTAPENNGTVSVATASVGTVIPIIVTPLPPNYTPPPTPVPPTLTPIPPLPGGLGPTELKYRVLAQFPNFFFCDPDYYPVARDDEMDLARQRFPELQANAEEFNAILKHNDLSDLTAFTDDQKLHIYREHKKLAALQFELAADGYQFQLHVAENEGQGELIIGLIDGQGSLAIQHRTPSFAACPICLAADTLIDTPTGPIPVQALRAGMWVWTLNQAGDRVSLPLIRVGKTVVPPTHQVVHLLLSDGREVWISPGHPTADGRRLGDLRAGDFLDGAAVLSTERMSYTGSATYDVLPAGVTGVYWANRVLMGSTLK